MRALLRLRVRGSCWKKNSPLLFGKWELSTDWKSLKTSAALAEKTEKRKRGEKFLTRRWILAASERRSLPHSFGLLLSGEEEVAFASFELQLAFVDSQLLDAGAGAGGGERENDDAADDSRVDADLSASSQFEFFAISPRPSKARLATWRRNGLLAFSWSPGLGAIKGFSLTHFYETARELDVKGYTRSDYQLLGFPVATRGVHR